MHNAMRASQSKPIAPFPVLCAAVSPGLRFPAGAAGFPVAAAGGAAAAALAPAAGPPGLPAAARAACKV